MQTKDIKLGMAVTLMKGPARFQARVEKFERPTIQGRRVERVRVKRLKSGRTELVLPAALAPIEEFWRAEAAKKQYAEDLKAVGRECRRLEHVAKTGALCASEAGGMLRVEIPAVHAQRVVDLLLSGLYGVNAQTG